MRNREEKTFLFVILFLLLLIVGMSLSYPPRARLMPFLAGVIGLFLVCLQLSTLILPVITKKLKFLDTGELISQNADVDKVKITWFPILLSFSWIAGYVIIMYINPLLAAVIFLLTFSFFLSKLTLINSLKITLGTGIFLYLVFGVLLRVF